jgi:general secretion pathway protein G
MIVAKGKIHKQGFGLMALLIVIVILVALGILVLLVVSTIWVDNGFSVDKRSATKSQMSNLEVGLDSYRLDMFQYPNNLEELVKNNSSDQKWKGPYLKNGILPKDPWGNPYQYRKPGNEGREYDLYSFGADGQEGGEGEQADVSSWQVE